MRGPVVNCVYLLRCADDTLYCGWTSDIARRMAAHNTGSGGAKYTRSRRPVRLLYCEDCASRGEAMRREAALKKLPRTRKLALAASAGERLTIYDSRMQPCGEMPRAAAHRCGLRHRVVHVLVRGTFGGVPGVWLQQRGFDRPLLPGTYDWTATGHVDPGETLPAAAARELREEAGLVVLPDALRPAGEMRYRVLRPDGMVDDEVASTFLLDTERVPPFAAGPEVAVLLWVPADALTAAFDTGASLTARLHGGGTRTIEAPQICCSAKEWRTVRRVGCGPAAAGFTK